jgi:hypothetical protein
MSTKLPSTLRAAHRAARCLPALALALGLAALALPSSAQAGDPKASFTRKYDNSYENSQNGSSKYDYDRMGRSPSSLPRDRVRRETDPLGQRGKVTRVEWRSGDDFRTSPGTYPRSWLSSSEAFTFKDGDTVSFAWGFYTDKKDVRAYIAQNICDGGPVWMIQITNEGRVLFSLHGDPDDKHVHQVIDLDHTISTTSWTDFKVDFKLTGSSTSGWVDVYINGTKKFSRTGLHFDAKRANGRFDCGIYNKADTNPTRIVYFSNLSIGKK